MITGVLAAGGELDVSFLIFRVTETDFLLLFMLLLLGWWSGSLWLDMAAMTSGGGGGGSIGGEGDLK